jgi:hypothetical protein
MGMHRHMATQTKQASVTVPRFGRSPLGRQPRTFDSLQPCTFTKLGPGVECDPRV